MWRYEQIGDHEGFSGALLPAADLLFHLLGRNLSQQVTLDVLVREDLLRVDPLADGEEVVKARVEFAQVGGRQGVGLGPMGFAGEEREEGRRELSKVRAIRYRQVERSVGRGDDVSARERTRRDPIRQNLPVLDRAKVAAWS